MGLSRSLSPSTLMTTQEPSAPANSSPSLSTLRLSSLSPRPFSMNAAKDATDLISKLRVFHNAAQKAAPEDKETKEFAYCGLDLVNGKVRNNLKNGVLEPAMSKVKSLKFATEASITIQRIDDMIKLIKPEQD